MLGTMRDLTGLATVEVASTVPLCLGLYTPHESIESGDTGMRGSPWTWLLAAIAAVVGTVAGAISSHLESEGGLTTIGGGLVMMGVIVVVVGLGVLTALTYATPPQRGAALPLGMAGALVAIGAIVGGLVLPALGAPIRVPKSGVVVSMNGKVDLSLTGVDATVSPGTQVICELAPSGSLAHVYGGTPAILQSRALHFNLVFPEPPKVGGHANLDLPIDVGMLVTDQPDFPPGWTGTADIATMAQDGLTGSLTFAALGSGTGPDVGPAPTGMPEALAGSLTWSCARD